VGYARAVSPTSVRIVLSDRDGRVLMLQRAADDDILPGAWELPGGGIDPGETPVQAAARELREEVGVTLDEVALSDWGTFRRAGGRCTAFFAADCAAGDCSPALSHEHDDWRWAEGPWEVEPLTPSARWAVGRHRWPDRDPR
jgi:8-oxo-dGTP pyrophosphatase MutT (NUDIX family)